MTSSLDLTVSAAGIRFGIRVIPRSPQTLVAGVRDGRLVIRVTAPPVDGGANDAVIATLADRLHVPRRAVRLVAGQTSRNKTVEVSGVDSATILARLLV